MLHFFFYFSPYAVFIFMFVGLHTVVLLKVRYFVPNINMFSVFSVYKLDTVRHSNA